ncbi:uncharacterized protein C8Q71DRAFT_779016 [Rhodofomes roseus]|uniref:Uncharacterized protein n=1 Tax=Rhodofomes roseus TaxID=34475 RepID=A0ABQ8K4Y9_9APHY|nr:uncharacterized protein C8Q71DRAFT_779016 [Rhodofomes roseus]KAH9831991.1 hypothetical protein C8Q71DRAFT_779016 [Rhodofomes roseus]
MLDSLMDELNTALTAVSEAERSLNLTHGATSLKRSRASAALDSETINPPIEDDAIKRSRTQYLPVFSRNPMNPYLAAGDAVPTLRQLLAIDTRAAYASGTLLESDILGEMKTNAGMLRDRINVDIPELSPKALEPAVFSASSDGKKTTANVLDRAMFSFDILGSEARTEDVYADLVRREVETTVVGDEDFDSSLSDILHDTGATFSQGSASLFGGCLAQKVQCAKCQDAKVLRKRLEEQIKTLQDQLATKQQKAQEVFQLSGENYCESHSVDGRE